ncbi:MAG: CDP-alcohol phosphatidyltransferase family protein [Bacilli bacterium]|nr:CDP-alcohol phosphatidyltransferase family protein [Bacilli bacterium]
MFIGKYNKSLIISYLGVTFAVVGMYFLATKCFKSAIICLIIAGVCDMFDGKIARMCKRDKDEEMFGIQLDSLADTIDFVAFPIVLGLSLGFNEWYNVVSYVLLAMAGIQRLCHFNVLVINKKDKGPVKFYSGLPVTSTAITYPLFWLISNYITTGAYHIIYTVLTYLTAFLFVLNIKIPKLRGVAYPITAVVAVVAIVMICLI